MIKYQTSDIFRTDVPGFRTGISDIACVKISNIDWERWNPYIRYRISVEATI